MVMSPRTADKSHKSAGIVTDFQEGKRALSSAGIRKNAQASHEAAEAGLDRLRKTLASEHGMHPGLERMREKLSRAVCAVRMQHENRLAAASNMSDVDVVLEMSEFVRQQVLPQAPLAGWRQTDGLALLLVK
jgi:flagellin